VSTTLRPGTMIRIQCAAISNGCMSDLTFTLDGEIRIDLSAEAADDPQITRVLTGAGWRLDYGRWVCPAHP
jgi:hypothetical protein